MNTSPAGNTTRDALRGTRLLVGSYVCFSILTVVAIVALRNDTTIVTSAAWGRGIIVLASSLLTLSFTVRAGRGNARAYLRLRIASAIMLAAIVVIVALPGAFPVWLRLEQGVCGLLLLGVVLIVNSGRVRATFAG